MIHALMEPNGRLYLTVPAYQWLWSVVDDDSGHYRRYTIKSLWDIFSCSGFRIELVSYFFLPLVLPIYLFRALPSRLGSRKGGNIEGCQGELAPSSSLVNGFLAYLLGFETSILEKHHIPFGASCVVVAVRN
jgi:hypothetical protein